jgi:hypothetical protein
MEERKQRRMARMEMNAYESAEYLEAREINNPHLIEIANLLRQQADRIAELEKSHIELEKGIVADLNQRQSAEPFIWLKQDFDGEWIEVHPHKGIPLYTKPQKMRLTDEEIHQIFRDESGFEIDTCPIAILDFARAILKKASEK